MMNLQESVIELPPVAETGVGVFEVRISIQELDDPALERTILSMKQLGVPADTDKRFLVELEMELEKRQR